MNEPNLLVQKLIEGCQDRNEVCQERLYKHYYSYAYSISRLHTYSKEEAFDIMNDSFLKVFDAIDDYNNDYPFKPWLRKIIINTSIDYFRKTKKHRYTLDVDEMEIPADYENILDRLNMEDILSLLDKLPEIHRMVFNLYEIQGYTHKEIAKKLRIGESSSRTFLTRAKKKLKMLFNVNFQLL